MFFRTVIILFIFFNTFNAHSFNEPDKWEVLYPAKEGVNHKFYDSQYFTVDVIDEHVNLRWYSMQRLKCYKGIDEEFGFISLNGKDVKLKTVCDGRWADIQIMTPQGMKFIYDYLYDSNNVEYKIVLANNAYRVGNLKFRKTIKDDHEKQYIGFGKPVPQNSTGVWLVNKKSHNEIKLFPSIKSKKDKFISIVYFQDTAKMKGKIDLSSAIWSRKIRHAYNQKIHPTLNYCDYRKRKDVAILTINKHSIKIPIECKNNGGRTFSNKKGEPINVHNNVKLNSSYEFDIDKELMDNIIGSKYIDINYSNHHLLGMTFNKIINLNSNLKESIQRYNEYTQKMKKERLEADNKSKARAENAL